MPALALKLAGLTCFLFLLAPIPGQDAVKPTESIESLIQKGLEAHRAGKSTDAVKYLQTAISRIQESGAANLASFLPEPKEGWKASKPTTASGSWGSGKEAFQWTQVERTYRHEKDKLRVTVTFTNSPQLVVPQAQLMKVLETPGYLDMMNRDPDQKIELLKLEGWSGFKTFKTAGSAEVMAICEGLLAMVQVNRNDRQLLEEIMAGIDMKKLAKLQARTGAPS